MLTIYSPRHTLRDAKTELFGGELVAPFECPRRAEIILERLRAVGLADIRPPVEHGRAPIERVHDAAYLAFLESCWEQWVAAGMKGEAISTTAPSRRMWRDRPPKHIDGLIGYYCLAWETSITATTYQAARLAADVTLTAAEAVREGARAAFALCRPPGHHAAQDMFGGYCFLNNAAIAAEAMRAAGAARVAILDVDFHHGNGTEAIFYDRDDVLFLSLHGEPETSFPYFLGYADERGAGRGEGFNVNYPMAAGTPFSVWDEAHGDACKRIAAYSPDFLVVSLGLDTYKDDPISTFKLESDDFLAIGRRIARLGLPTLFVLEGGYAVDQLGINAVNVLTGFEEG
ncbi:MAG: histone deacetylase family protein [Rhizobiales bacterium]|nr:histone deacetylase family protein [Hyphomicrobiales bacterium]